MSFLERFLGGDSEKSVGRKLSDLLDSRDEKIAVVDPVTEGLLPYRISSASRVSKVLAAAYIPGNEKAYRQFISMDEVAGFPHKQVANAHDAQLIANQVREETGAEHGISVLAPLDGTANQTVYNGINIHGDQVGVFEDKLNFHEDGFRKKASGQAIRRFFREYRRRLEYNK